MITFIGAIIFTILDLIAIGVVSVFACVIYALVKMIEGFGGKKS